MILLLGYVTLQRVSASASRASVPSSRYMAEYAPGIQSMSRDNAALSRDLEPDPRENGGKPREPGSGPSDEAIVSRGMDLRLRGFGIRSTVQTGKTRV